MTSEFFLKQRECRFYTAGNKMAVSVTGPTAKLGGPTIPGKNLLESVDFDIILCEVEKWTLIKHETFTQNWFNVGPPSSLRRWPNIKSILSECLVFNGLLLVWRAIVYLEGLSSNSSHHPQYILLAQCSLYVHKGGLKPHSFIHPSTHLIDTCKIPSK